MASSGLLLSSAGSDLAFLAPLEHVPRPVTLPLGELNAPPAPIASGLAGSASPNSAAWAVTAAAAVGCAAGAKRARRLAALARAAKADEEQGLSRSDLLRGLGGGSFASALGGATVFPLSPAPVMAASLDQAKATLTSYGLPNLAPEINPPGGWSVVVEPIGLAPDAYYGRFNLGGEPQVVVFYAPPLWVVSKPNIDFNGAAGTVQANDYGKGDSATLWVDTAFQGDLDALTKKEYKEELIKALTTKGKGFIEALKVNKVTDGSPGYKIVEYDYDVESMGGTSIARSGVASFAQVGNDKKLQVFWTGCVTTRWRDMNKDLAFMASTFRVGSVPKSVSSMIKEFKNMDEAMSAGDLPSAPFA